MNSNLFSQEFSMSSIAPTNPVLVIESIYQPTEQSVPKLNFSGICFLYKKWKEDTYLAVTAGHFFWPNFFDVPQGSRLSIVKDYGTINGKDVDFLPFEIVSPPLLSRKLTEDIAILIVRPVKKPKEDFILFDTNEDLSQLERLDDVFIAQVNEKTEISIFEHKIIEKKSFVKINLSYEQAMLIDKSSPNYQAYQKIALDEESVVSSYPCFSVFTDFGASGSPVWTKDNKLLGVNSGGVANQYASIVPTVSIQKLIEKIELKFS